jgi:hypothetical protein
MVIGSLVVPRYYRPLPIMLQREKNPAALVAQLETGDQPVTLLTVAATILDRERGKLETLIFENPKVKDDPHRPDEQHSYLAIPLHLSYACQPTCLPAL